MVVMPQLLWHFDAVSGRPFHYALVQFVLVLRLFLSKPFFGASFNLGFGLIDHIDAIFAAGNFSGQDNAYT